MSETTLLWPHENPIALARASSIPMDYPESRLLEIGYSYLGAIPELRITVPPKLAGAVLRAEFRLFNGHNVGSELGDKTKFAGIMEDLGYNAPRTTLVLPTDDPGDAFERIAALDIENQSRFLKPRYGRQAKGTMLAEAPDRAIELIRGMRRPYLAQTVETADHEWRYALHRDAKQVREDAPHGWRLAFHKKRASLTGDGTSTLAELVANDPNMKRRTRLKFKLHQGKDIHRVPALGEHIEFAIGGNTGARLPAEVELSNLDQFMTRLSGELEAHIGASLATICFDIGARKADTLTKPYDYERLRRELVFYEYQVPFSFSEYSDRVPRNHNGEKWESYLRWAGRAVLTDLAFTNSLLTSGKMAQAMHASRRR